MSIKITTPSTGPVEATLSEKNPGTARAFIEALPITGKANLWGDEIYFSIPVETPPEDGKSVVELGDARAISIFMFYHERCTNNVFGSSCR